MILTENEKNKIRKYMKNGDTGELYEYVEKIINQKIDDAVWHATIGDN